MTAIDAIVAKDRIRDVLALYARGCDRLDTALVRSCYHPDAINEFGYYSGDLDGFIDFLTGAGGATTFERSMHFGGSPLIELDGDAAYAETYCHAYHLAGPDHPWGSGLLRIALRYVDRFEERRGEWRIAHRIAVYEWVTRAAPEAAESVLPPGAVMGHRNRSDALYAIRERRRSSEPLPSR